MEEIERLESKEEDDWVLLLRCTSKDDTASTEEEQRLSIGTRNSNYGSTSADSTGRSTQRVVGGKDTRSERLRLGKSSKRNLGNGNAFDNTYYLIGPLLHFVQDPRCGATSCFIGSTRVTSGNCSTNTPVKETTSPLFSSCGLSASSPGLPYSSCNRLSSETLLRPQQSASISKSEFVQGATRDALARPTPGAARSVAGVHVRTGVLEKDDSGIREAQKATSTRETPTAGRPAALPAEAAVEGAPEGGQAAARKTFGVGVVHRTGGGTTSAEYEIMSAEEAGNNVTCSVSGVEIGFAKQREGQPLRTDAAAEDVEETIVTAIEYEAYEPMALQQLRAACKSAREAHPGIVKIAVMHLLGLCKLGQPGLIIFVSAPHRQESQNACALLVDLIKHHVPIWKVELLSPRSSNRNHADCCGESRSDYGSTKDSCSSEIHRSCSIAGSRRSSNGNAGDSWDERTDPSSSTGGPIGSTRSPITSSCCRSGKGLSSRNTGGAIETGERVSLSASTPPHGNASAIIEVHGTYRASGNGCTSAAVAYAAGSAASPEAVCTQNSSNTSDRGKEEDRDGGQTQSAARAAYTALPTPVPHQLLAATSSRGGNSACRNHQCDLPSAGNSRESSRTDTAQRRTLGDAAALEELPVTTSKRRRVQGHVLQFSLPLVSSASK